MSSAIGIIVLLNILPLIYARVLCKKAKNLENEEVSRKIGNLYDNKNVKSGKDHKVWVFPISFFFRRVIFAILTIFLFDRPNLQMIAHQFISLLTIVYLSRDQTRFKDKGTQVVEIGTEMLLLCTCTLIQQFILPLDEVQ